MSVRANQLILFLCCIGIFIAGVLSFSAANNILVPCTAGAQGCSTVALSPYSKIGGVSVSYIGLAGYFALLVLALLRYQSEKMWKTLGMVGFIGSLGGLLFSLYLTFVSFVVLRAACQWCLGSLTTILMLFFAHAILISNPDRPERFARWDQIALGAGAAIAILGFAMTTESMLKSNAGKVINLNGLSEAQVIGPSFKAKGNADAPVTIVEFADVNCPTCRVAYPVVKGYAEKYKGKVRLVFRHFPLSQIPGHETSMAAARIADFAGSKGKYFAFLDKVFDPSNTERVKAMGSEGLLAIAEEVGLNKEELRAALNNDNDPSVTTVTDDLVMAARTLKLGGTPSFIVIAKGTSTRLIPFNELESTLGNPTYKAIIGN